MYAADLRLGGGYNMAQYAFHVWWAICFVLLLFVASWIGRKANLGPLGILIDRRGRYSLTHFQVVVWTLLILSSLLGVLLSKDFDPAGLRLSAELLGLMGISAGSAVLATGVKATKDALGSNAQVAWVGRTIKRRDGVEDTIEAHFAQIWLEEEGAMADKVISITKYQNFVITLVVVAFYVSITWKQAALPNNLPESVVWLIGISHAGYVGGKVPNQGPDPENAALASGKDPSTK
jgi:hypothetical protein